METDQICNECKDKIINFYSFKQSIKIKNESKPLKNKNKEILKKVEDFIIKNDNKVDIIEHNNCLSIIPESEKMSVGNVRFLDDYFEPPPLKIPKLEDSLNSETSCSSSISLNEQSFPTNTTKRKREEISAWMGTCTPFQKRSIISEATKSKRNLINEDNEASSDFLCKHCGMTFITHQRICAHLFDEHFNADPSK